MDRWASQLSPGGRLLVEEPESIRTERRLFKGYLEVLEALMRHQGKTLYLGPVLDRAGNTENLTRRVSRVYRLAVPDRRVAQMFSMNIQTWKTHPFVAESYSRDRLDRMQRELEDAAGDTRGGTTEWRIRQLVYQRAP